jgi:hypothetical protein
MAKILFLKKASQNSPNQRQTETAKEELRPFYTNFGTYQRAMPHIQAGEG